MPTTFSICDFSFNVVIKVKIVVGLFFLRCVLYSVRSFTGGLKAADTLNLFSECRVLGVFVFKCQRCLLSLPALQACVLFYFFTVAFVCESLQVLKVILSHFPGFFDMLSVM